MKENIDLESADPNIAEEIKEAYYQLTHREHLRKTKNPQLDAAANKAALICQQLKCDPYVYVKAQLKFWAPVKASDLFYPSYLATYRASDNVGKYLNMKTDATEEAMFHTQVDYLSSAVYNTNRTIEEILLDDCIGFEPWFRCVITSKAIPSVLKKYGYKASQQLKSTARLAFITDWQRKNNKVLDLSRIPIYE